MLHFGILFVSKIHPLEESPDAQNTHGGYRFEVILKFQLIITDFGCAEADRIHVVA